jgi:hypothetical protein
MFFFQLIPLLVASLTTLDVCLYFIRHPNTIRAARFAVKTDSSIAPGLALTIKK